MTSTCKRVLLVAFAQLVAITAGHAQDAAPPVAPAPGAYPVPPPLPDIEGLPPADDIPLPPPLPDIEGLPPADDIPSGPSPQGPAATEARVAPPVGAGAGVDESGETVVRVKRRVRAVTSTRTSVAEAQRLPGTQGDAIRVVESLPGVGRASFASGQLLLWGASPESSRIYVDGVPIPLLFHGGGVRSVLNGFFVKEIELVPGAYGADFGGAAAGMVKIATSQLQEGFHGVVSADLLDASATASAQVSKRLFVGAGFRYGYLDRLAPLVASKQALQYTLIPQYRDYQGRVEWRLSESSRISLMLFGSYDRASAEFSSDDPARGRSSLRGADFMRVVTSFSGTTASGATVQFMAYGGSDESLRSEAVGPFAYELDTDAKVAGLRASWIGSLAEPLRLHVGVSVESWFTSAQRQGSVVRPAREGDVYAFGQPPAGDLAADRWRTAQINVSPYVELPISLWKKRLDITPGLRLSATLNNASREYPPIGDTPLHGVARLNTFLEPRLMINLRATTKLSFKLGGGIYYTVQNPADLSSVFGTPTLGAARSRQAIVGAGYDLTRDLNLEALGFVRKIDDYVGRNDATSPPAGRVLSQEGEARAYGGQLLLRQRLAHGLTGWLAYTLQRSEVRYHPDLPYHVSDYDQTHLFTGVASYELGKGFTIGTRLRVISGLPRTPVTGRVFDSLTGDFQPLFGEYNSTRLPMVTLLDARVDKTFKIGSGKLIVFVDVLNVLNRPPSEEILYDPGYTQRSYLSGLPIVADFGLRGEL